MILLVTHTNDSHADLVETRLLSRSATCIRFNTDRLTVDAGFEAHWDGCKWRGKITQKGARSVDFQDIHAVWWRRPVEPLLSAITDRGVRKWAQDESFTGYTTILSGLSARFLNHPDAMNLASNKPQQLVVASSVGFRTPETLVTHAPESARSFIERHAKSGVALKPMKNMRILASDGVERVLYTSPVHHSDLGDGDECAAALHQFQEYIAKHLEIRVTVVAEQVFAAEIHSQASEHTRYDWRNYDIPRTPHWVHQLPQAVRNKCVEIVRQLGLEFGAIDLVLTPEGEYVFLEINPNGQWQWIEVLTGLQISGAVCDRLAELDL